MNVLIGVFAGHHTNSPNAPGIVMVGGVRHFIWGHSTPFEEAGVPRVMLLSDDGPPCIGKIHPDAERNFQAAAERLIREGTEFYTVFWRTTTWSLPAMRWTREYR